MDTIIFAVLLAVGLIIVFSKKRWLTISSWLVALVLVAVLFNHHVTSALDWSF
ncbi:MAG: DUF5993 family protein [Microbacteriaceae bacterium]